MGRQSLIILLHCFSLIREEQVCDSSGSDCEVGRMNASLNDDDDGQNNGIDGQIFPFQGGRNNESSKDITA